jgi:predicted nuclease of restriction endonuclease-like (RecB) superfamily
MIPEKKYTKFAKTVKERILSSRIAVAHSVNRELISLYWEIGKLIVEKQDESGWGKAVVDTLSKDLQKEFPSVTGFSSRNLWDMKRLYEQYCKHEHLRQLVAEIPWGHNLLIMNKIKD